MQNGEAHNALDWLGLDEVTAARLAQLRETPDGEKRIDNIIHDSITRSARALAREWKRTARREALAYHRTYRTGFEKRLATHWKRALDLYEAIYIASLEASADLCTKYEIEPGAEKDLVFQALKLLHGRACLTASEIRALLASGHPDGATGRWRTLHELAVVANLIKEHGAGLAERYLWHEYVETLKNAECYQESSTTLQRLAGSGYEPIAEDDLQDLRVTVGNLVRRYGPRYRNEYGWAADLVPGKGAPTFRQLEELTGLSHLRPYYRLGNQSIHAGAKAAVLNVLARGPNRIMLAGPTNAGLDNAGQGALISLNQVTTSLLVYGWESLQDPMLLVTCSALSDLVSEACEAFAAGERRLEAKERALWERSKPHDGSVESADHQSRLTK